MKGIVALLAAEAAAWSKGGSWWAPGSCFQDFGVPLGSRWGAVGVYGGSIFSVWWGREFDALSNMLQMRLCDDSQSQCEGFGHHFGDFLRVRISRKRCSHLHGSHVLTSSSTQKHWCFRGRVLQRSWESLLCRVGCLLKPCETHGHHFGYH